MANKMNNSYGSGDMANENTPSRVMGIAEAGKERMNSVAARQKLAKKTNLNPPQKSTRASEPVQSDAFKSGYRSS